MDFVLEVNVAGYWAQAVILQIALGVAAVLPVTKKYKMLNLPIWVFGLLVLFTQSWLAMQFGVSAGIALLVVFLSWGLGMLFTALKFPK